MKQNREYGNSVLEESIRTNGDDYARSSYYENNASTGSPPITLYWQSSLIETGSAWLYATTATHVWQYGNNLHRKESGCAIVPPRARALCTGRAPAQFLESWRTPGQQ